MLVLDTDVVTHLQYPDSQPAQTLISRLMESNRSTAVTVKTFEEQIRGRLAVSSQAKTPEAYSLAADALYRLLREYQDRIVLPFDESAVTEFKRLKAIKVRIGTMDMRIASIVLANDATLITMNRRDYDRVPGLRVEDWTKS